MTLNPGNPANATEQVNLRDNVEQVELVNAAPGTWTIQLTGTNVPQGPQDYAITWNLSPGRQCIICQ